MTISIGVLASVSSRTFEHLAKSGAIPAADVAAARALRAGRTVKRHVEVDIRKGADKEVAMLPTIVEKIARSERTERSLADAISAYQKKHGCSRAVAADMVLLSPTVSESVRLEKQETELARDVRMDKLQGTWTDTNPATRQSPAMAPLVARPSDAVTTHDSDELLAQIKSGGIPWNDPRAAAAVEAERRRKFGY
jgi:hypothetical protein